MHIGLVRELKANQTAADGHTCYLGSLGGSSFQVTSTGNVVFDGVFAIPERCLVNDDPATFNGGFRSTLRVLMKLTKRQSSTSVLMISIHSSLTLPVRTLMDSTETRAVSTGMASWAVFIVSI